MNCFFGPLSYVMEISSSQHSEQKRTKLKLYVPRTSDLHFTKIKVKWTKIGKTENQEKQQNPVKVHEQITHKQNSSNRIFYENSCECLPFLCSVPKSIITQYPSLNNSKKNTTKNQTTLNGVREL